MTALIDTHAWLWWVTADKRLSRRARAAVEGAQRSETLWLSTISIWEIAKKVEKRQLVLDREVDAWLDQALAQPGLQVVEVNRVVLVDSCRLPTPFHGDPADQIIVATARHRGAHLVTADARIRAYPHVQCMW
jgi:PIN domain nuclease of toxin-antitoxin system